MMPCRFSLNLPLFGLGPSSKGLGSNLWLSSNRIASCLLNWQVWDYEYYGPDEVCRCQCSVVIVVVEEATMVCFLRAFDCFHEQVTHCVMVPCSSLYRKSKTTTRTIIYHG